MTENNYISLPLLLSTYFIEGAKEWGSKGAKEGERSEGAKEGEGEMERGLVR